MKLCSYELSTVVRLVREHAGYSSYAKVEDAGCTTRYLADIESGKARPKPDLITDIAKAFKSRRILQVYCETCPVKAARQHMNKNSKDAEQKSRLH